ncbi:MAG: hypothetical protein KF729_18655 [Sandaracinaceae bacterium]|nr:hypothetical protein [Sandaracinaceae bacterium]
MSTKNLSDLLDSMLDDSALEQAAEDVRRREAQERAQAAAELAEKRAAAAPEAPRALDDVAQLTGLIEKDLRRVLGEAAPDDLLVVLATAGDVVQRRILRNLGPESVAWVRANLEHIEHVTDHERDQASAKLLKVANALLRAGTIAWPEPEAVGKEEAPDPERRALRELLVDLVRIAEQAGPEALTELAESAGEPLLLEGLAKVGAGSRGAALREALAPLRAELERRYAQRLAWMTEALVAIGDGEAASAFDARVFVEG